MESGNFRVIGLMSGTSLDGLDIACCDFSKSSGKWTFSLLKACTREYSDDWRRKLTDAHLMSAEGLLKLDVEYGRFLGQRVNDFLEGGSLNVELVGSHGHTVFHSPQQGLSYQLGFGKAIAFRCGLPVVSDFRMDDVLAGGQGAPLVPAGDYYLFGDYPYCLNLGGFANISEKKHQGITAFDICPVNFVMNRLAAKKGQKMDRDGALAKEGKTHPKLLKALNALDYYKQTPPKSLGREWVVRFVDPLLSRFCMSAEDALSTYVEHVSHQIAAVLNQQKQNKQVLVTGGGAKNGYLVQRITEKTRHQIIIPDQKVIDYKEAVVFAFLALLRHLGEINIFSSATGAGRDTSAGTLFMPGKGHSRLP